MLFKLEDFIAAPSQELLNLAKKSDLLDIASHYSIPDVKTSMLKREIKNVIIQFLVDEEFFEPSATSLIMVSQTDIQLKELELKRHLELEKLRLEFEEKRRADKEEREERMQKEKLELEKQKLAFEEMEREKQIEMEERQKEKQREMEEREKTKQREMEEREKEKQREMEEREKEKHREMLKEIELEKERMHYDIKMKELELSSKSMPPVSFDPSKVFDVTKHIRLVPPFQEKEVDKYFLHFEKVAENLKWPKEHWTLLLQSVVIGKAREIYTQLPLDQSSDYDTVKNLILKAYELVPEAYRQKFRNCRKEHDQTHVEFARTKEQLFDRWCSSKDVKSDYAKLRQLMLVEEFKRCIHSDVKSFLDEREVETLDVAARLADDYALTHKVSFVNKPYKKPFNPQFKPNTPQSKPFNPQQRNNSPQPNPQPQAGLTADSSSPSHNPKNKDTSEKKGQRSSYSPRLFCNYSKGDGHVISECETLKRRKERQNQNNSRPTGLTSLRSKPQSIIQDENPILAKTSATDCIMEIYEPFLSEGFVSLTSDSAQSTPIKILRDTGASQSLILADILPFSEKTSTGTSVLIQGVECGFVNVPLHNIYLSSDLVSGPVAVGIRPSLPFKGVHLLLGNDLAGDKVVVNPLLTNTPCEDQLPDPIEQEIPDLYPSCAVTRAMGKKVKLNDGIQDVDLTDTFIGQSFHDEISKSLSSSQTDFNNQRSDNDLSPSIFDQGHDQMSRSQLCQEQHSDPEISPLFERALDENEISQVPVCFYVKNDILMRKWRPPDVSAEDEWTINHQIVVPKAYRPEILNLAHETPMSGHLGINKTYHKILKHFYWPGLKSDVSQHCKSCHTCQMVGKPNQTIPKANLQPIPAFDEPFSRIIIDCVGPLPKTKSGCQYLLTIMCASTRFPEAIPLRNIKTKTIVKALVKFFTLVGLPKSVQSDQGSNFMSGTFQQVMHELGIKQYKSSAYHPESQGALERFHQTLKNMIRSYCFDTEKDWDEGIHLLLFAVRESVQESLGFSPFELVFGHTVRGPLKLMKEKFLSSNDSPLNLLQYVSDFKTRLTKAWEVARSNLKSAQNKMKLHFDENAQNRNFDPGDKVIALLPIPGRPLQARYYGPYTVEKKLSDVNYIVNTPGRRKQKQLCHINMLKKYIDRDSDNDSSVISSVSIVNSVPHEQNQTDFEEMNSVNCEPLSSKLQNSDILHDLDQKLSHLDPDKKHELKQLILEYEHLFPDIPSRTDKIYHDVDIIEGAKPVKQHPYRLHPERQQYLRKEVKYLLDNDFIEPSQSEWSSPCILVPKSDGTFRMCTDYRKVNSVTKTDTFPIPRIDDCIDNIGHAKYVTKFDLLKGFWQIPLTDREFKMAVDASDVGAGSVLLQEDDNGVDHPVCYFSKKFDKHQRNYSTIEKECLSLILALQHFQVYLSSANSPIVVFSDHNPLTFIHKMKNKNQRLLRWSLMLQEHNLDIRHIKGRDNIIPDTLSRA